MAYPEVALANTVTVSGTLADISDPSTLYVPAPAPGYLVRAYSCLGGAITGSDATWTTEINGVAVANSTVTITASGSAAGDVDSVEFSRMDPPRVAAGDQIAFVSAGESSTTARCNFVAVIRT